MKRFYLFSHAEFSQMRTRPGSLVAVKGKAMPPADRILNSGELRKTKAGQKGDSSPLMGEAG